MEWVLGLGALYIFLQIVLPLVALAAIAYLAYRWANKDRQATFASSEPDRRDLTEEHHFQLEDVHHPDDQPPRA
jgi:hypothetical protein